MHRRLAALLVTLALTAPLTGEASAEWSVSASGGSAASAGTLAEPTSVTVTWDPVVHVSWTASATPWAAGYRVFRSVSAAGPWTQIADVSAPATTVDDSPGAGTHHYAVRAYTASWSSQISGVAVRTDPRYVFTSTSGVSGSGCLAAGGGNFRMQQGWPPAGAGLSRTRNDGTFSFCTEAFSAGQSLPAGTTTLTAGIVKSNGDTCSITAMLMLNGATLLGSGVLTVSQGGLRMETVSFPTGSATFAAGDRLQLLLSWEGVKACTGTDLHWGKSTAPTALTLAG